MKLPASVAWWMYALNGVILGILAFKTWATLRHPDWLFGPANALETAHVRALWELAGRNLAMLAISLAALVKPSVWALRAVFAMGIVREVADMVSAAAFNPVTSGSIARTAVFFGFIGLYVFALRELSSTHTD